MSLNDLYMATIGLSKPAYRLVPGNKIVCHNGQLGTIKIIFNLDSYNLYLTFEGVKYHADLYKYKDLVEFKD